MLARGLRSVGGPGEASTSVGVALVEDLLAVLADASPPAGVVVDLEGRVGGALQQVAHAIPVGDPEASAGRERERERGCDRLVRHIIQIDI